MRSRRGHIAALSADGGLEQMGWLNQGESAGLDARLYVSVYLSAPSRCTTSARGRFYAYKRCFCLYL